MALDAMVLAAFFFLLFLFAAADRQQVAAHLNVNFLWLEARHVHFHFDGRTVSTEQGARLTIFSATLPRKRCEKPVRP